MKKMILIAVVAIVLYFMFMKRKTPMQTLTEKKVKHTIPTDVEFKRVFSKIAGVFGSDVAKNVEKIYRLETGNFKSGQFVYTYSPGMLKQGSSFPFGWTSIKSLWEEKPEYSPTYVTTMVVGGKNFTYLGFDNFEAAALALATYVKKYGAARWNSTDASQQVVYMNSINKITTKYA